MLSLGLVYIPSFERTERQDRQSVDLIIEHDWKPLVHRKEGPEICILAAYITRSYWTRAPNAGILAPTTKDAA